MACNACEAMMGDEGVAPALLLWHGTRIAVRACERHTNEIDTAFSLLNAFYDASYQEAVTELTSTLLALRSKD